MSADFEFDRLRAAWDEVLVARGVTYSLFTFGESQLPYYLVVGKQAPGGTVTVAKGEVRVARPLIITPDTAAPELQNFFEESDDGEAIRFLLARSAAFSNLRLTNQSGTAKLVTDSVEEAISRLNQQLDDAEEDQVAILTAPPGLGGFAVLRYAAERILQSTPDNLQELRERGFLP
jgi:hypothetical protein